ncbi:MULTISPECIES: methyl-accepting chemotaxis protein [unclassified Hahella]|uniref:methyl-accepting chemotaxis protein n=1 Tax=unclassified Hahella TaxID=2624107 RepID=UPI001C1EEFF6|nr:MULTISPECIES: methyl-accepting chemotaxis protein [unclassified Hahella]MBU6951048.1 methyl-accepting chemotaxis protein [Hahella sp. HN01]MDG9666778.1 methyl-accepting chemotaxis protein [Hahella sp. CR1]
MPKLLRFFTTRLLRPVLIVLCVAVALQIVANILLGQFQLNNLVKEVESGLRDSRQKVSTELSAAESTVATQLQTMSDNAQQQLQSKLGAQLETQRKDIAQNLRQTLDEGVKNLTGIVAAIAPPAIWDRDTPELTRLAQLVDNSDSIVFAGFYGFFGQEPEQLTRYVDRTDEKVQELIKQGEGKGSLAKVIDAAEKDPGIVVIRTDIAPQGAVIGQFVVGVSTSRIDGQMERLKGQFSDLTNQSKVAVANVLGSELSRVSEALRLSLKNTETQTDESISSAVLQIREGAESLIGSLTTASLAAGVILVVLISLVLGVRVVLKVDVLSKAIWNIAEGEADLTQRVRIQGNDEIADVGKGLNVFIERIQKIVLNVNKSAELASSQSDELKQNTQHADEAVAHQKQEIEQISSAISEMSSSIHHVAEHVQLVANDVDHIKSETKKSGSISHNLRNMLHSLQSEMSNAEEVVNQLDSHSKEIGSVLLVIRTIAEQTNLLALNAAIEAARAGDSGRGFAVVADEVRTLANKTQQSTTEIQNRIDSLQSGSQSAVRSISAASERAKRSSEAFTESDSSLENINQLVIGLYDRTTEIASMAEEQSGVAEEINRNIVNIADASERTQQSAAESAQAGASIQQSVSDLRRQVSEFVV